MTRSVLRSVGRSIFHNLLKGRKVSFPCSNRCTFLKFQLDKIFHIHTLLLCRTCLSITIVSRPINMLAFRFTEHLFQSRSNKTAYATFVVNFGCKSYCLLSLEQPFFLDESNNFRDISENSSSLLFRWFARQRTTCTF